MKSKKVCRYSAQFLILFLAVPCCSKKEDSHNQDIRLGMVRSEVLDVNSIAGHWKGSKKSGFSYEEITLHDGRIFEALFEVADEPDNDILIRWNPKGKKAEKTVSGENGTDSKKGVR